MAVTDALRKLAGVVEEYEEGRVTAVESRGSVDADGGMVVTAEIELPLSTTPGTGSRRELELSDATFDGDGTLQFELESTAPAGFGGDHDVTVEPQGVTIDADGTPTVTLVASAPVDTGASMDGEVSRESGASMDGEVSRESGASMDGGSASVDSDVDGASGDGSTDGAVTAGEESTGRIDARRERDVPPFRDPELLAEVYESCDTFAEMTDELGMDVTAETVRRYMIDYDIHQPNSYETGDDGGDAGSTGASDDREAPTPEAGGAPTAGAGEEGDSPVVLPDGIGLPDDVTVDSFIETVKRSNTIYEVKRDVGIDQDDALSMLQELNLLDLVVGRLATEAERDIRREEIVERLREASANQ